MGRSMSKRSLSFLQTDLMPDALAKPLLQGISLSPKETLARHVRRID